MRVMVNVVLGVSLALALTWTACNCDPLQVAITDSSGADRSGDTSCVGDQITYTCILPTSFHVWTISPLGFQQTISPRVPAFPPPDGPDSQFSIMTVADEAGAITTALSVTSVAGLDGANITCADGTQVDGPVRDTIAMVFDPPTPGLTAVPGGDTSTSFDFTITRSNSSECVVNYTITATSSDDSRDITVLPREVDGSTPVIVGGFSDVCTQTYNFTILPVTSDSRTGPSFTSSGITAGVTGLMAAPASIEWTAPSGVPETCFPQYRISLPADPTVTLTVDDTTASSAELSRAGFLYCVSQEITVTPIVAVTNTSLTSSSATMELVVNDPVIGTVNPEIVVTSAGPLNATVSWEDDVQSRNRVVGIGRSVSRSVCMIVRNVTEANSTTVEFECNASEQVTMPPCVQYFDGGCSSMIFTVSAVNITCPTITPSPTPPTQPTQPTQTPTPPNADSSDLTGPVVGGVLGAVVVIIVLIIVVVIVLMVVKKKKGDDSTSGKEKATATYHSAGATAGSAGSPQTAVTVEEHAPGAMYADPKQIEHEAATTGDQYALITSNTKAKKKNGQPEARAELGDMYSVPDKTKKQQNQAQGLVYADIDIGQPKPAPRGQGSVKQQQQQDEEAVTYATVTSPM